ncbi:hypothetical protein NliqN6_1557 [Naganishia liquefaciens]|uniref:Uncharacterized protein n=1 Tax=Naganishia liquefaciens TaxID=104408 RepID=A0A8H3TRA4_9TREE|nr:hypothetical protein NliqN6_1557 [Naganishia liquefaciens]
MQPDNNSLESYPLSMDFEFVTDTVGTGRVGSIATKHDSFGFLTGPILQPSDNSATLATCDFRQPSFNCQSHGLTGLGTRLDAYRRTAGAGQNAGCQVSHHPPSVPSSLPHVPALQPTPYSQGSLSTTENAFPLDPLFSLSQIEDAQFLHGAHLAPTTILMTSGFDSFKKHLLPIEPNHPNNLSHWRQLHQGVSMQPSSHQPVFNGSISGLGEIYPHSKPYTSAASYSSIGSLPPESSLHDNAISSQWHRPQLDIPVRQPSPAAVTRNVPPFMLEEGFGHPKFDSGHFGSDTVEPEPGYLEILPTGPGSPESVKYMSEPEEADEETDEVTDEVTSQVKVIQREKALDKDNSNCQAATSIQSTASTAGDRPWSKSRGGNQLANLEVDFLK